METQCFGYIALTGSWALRRTGLCSYIGSYGVHKRVLSNDGESNVAKEKQKNWSIYGALFGSQV